MNRFIYAPKVSKGSVVKIIPPKVPVNIKPDKGGFNDVLCYLMTGVYLLAHETKSFPDVNVVWIRADCGWVMIANGGDSPIGDLITDEQEAQASWKLEKEKRQRMASAITAMMVKSYSLPKAIRMARSIQKHARDNYPEPTQMTKVAVHSMEDIMISLGGKTGLSKQQVFEYIKIAASRQSNPRQAVLEISEEIFNLMLIRPSTWVTNNLNVITTEDVRIRNNKFIMCAAEGYATGFLAYLDSASPPELTCLHSELHYTALHAAADFGKLNIIQILVDRGLSLDIRDPVKGQTPLHFCAYSGREEVAAMLLTNGANRQLRCGKGILPHEAAFQQGHFDCAELLKFPPPSVIKIEVTFIGIDTISIIWDTPTLDPHHNGPVLKYHLQCVYVDGSVDVPDEPTVTTSKLHHTYRHLYPSAQYAVRIQAEALAGTSPWSHRILAKTLPTVPDTPIPVEIHKVIINGLYIKWCAPVRCNGERIDHYEIEVVDYESKEQRAIPLGGALEEEDEHEHENENNEEECTLLQTSSILSTESWDSPTATGSKPASPAGKRLKKKESQKKLKKLLLNSRSNTPVTAGGSTMSTASSSTRTSSATTNVSKLYRLLKHNAVKTLAKNLLGLEPDRPYQIRIRAHNKAGYSIWSDWCPPTCPRMGVWAQTINPLERCITMTWFQPVLSPPLVSRGRCVSAYELQVCRVSGPTVYTRSVKEYEKQLIAKKRAEELAKTTFYFGDTAAPTTSKAKPRYLDDLNEYITISNTIPVNTFDLVDLKPGNRYKCRIRCKINEDIEWEDWEHAMYSEIVSLPPTRPDKPFFVRPQVKKNAFVSFSPSQEDEKHVLQPAAKKKHTENDEDSVERRRRKRKEKKAREREIRKQDWRYADEPENENDEKENDNEEEADLLDEDDTEEDESLTEGEGYNIFGNNDLDSNKFKANPWDKDKLRPTDPWADLRSEQNTSSLEANNSSILSSSQQDFKSFQKNSEAAAGVAPEERTVQTAETYVNSNASSFQGPPERITLSDDLEIRHNELILTWQNGDANGQPIEQYAILCAHIRTYHPKDVIYAREAFLGVPDTNPIFTTSVVDGKNTGTIKSYEDDIHDKIYKDTSLFAAMTGESHILSSQSVDWKDITSQGVFLGPQSFLVQHLLPGHAYAFKVRQANSIGWSEYSNASPLISTYPSIPPRQPLILMTKDTFVVVGWEEIQQQPMSGGVALTTLDYEIQLRTLLASTKQADTAMSNGQTVPLQYSSDWFVVTTRQLPLSEAALYVPTRSTGTTGTTNTTAAVAPATTSYCAVMIQQLVEFQWYLARVRTRTVIGWSPWSETSEQFRMLK